MDPVGTVFGAATALSCGPLALLILGANSKSDGSSRVNTAHWVTSKGKHIRNATERELWEHNNPGKRWDKHQDQKRKGCLTALIPFGLLLPLAVSLVMKNNGWIREARTGIGPVWAAYAVLFGIAALSAAGIFSYKQMKALNLFSRKQKPLALGWEILNMAAAGLGLLYMLVFGVCCIRLGGQSKAPDSGLFRFFGNTFLWVCAGAGILLLVDGAISGILLLAQRKKDRKKAAMRNSMESLAKEGISQFVTRLAADPKFSCPKCGKTFRSINPRTVKLIGGLVPVCDRCYVPSIPGNESEEAVTIDYSKAKALADSIRQQAKS